MTVPLFLVRRGSSLQRRCVASLGANRRVGVRGVGGAFSLSRSLLDSLHYRHFLSNKDFTVVNLTVGSSSVRCTSSSSKTPSPVVDIRPLSPEDASAYSATTSVIGNENDGFPLSSAAAATPALESPTTRDYVRALSELSKLRLSTLVVATTSAGFLAAGGPAISVPTLLSCTVGTALCASSAATFNQLFEIDQDRRMKRTRNRPLVTGLISVPTATVIGTTTGLTGATVLAMGTDPLTTALGVGNIALYAGLYTGLKPRSEINTWVGAVVGAVPPVMGWTAATGGHLWDPEALILGGTLYLWQFPHFFALNWMHRVDYARGGFAMVSCNDPDGSRTAALIRRYAWYLSAVPLVSAACDVTSYMFALEGIVLNAYAIHVAHQFGKDRTNARARKVFLTSLWYLPCLMTLFILHSKTWEDKVEEEEENVRESSSEFQNRVREIMQAVKRKGREMCLHETTIMDLSLVSAAKAAAAAKKEGDSTVKNAPYDGGAQLACPVVLGREKGREAASASVADVANVMEEKAAAASGVATAPSASASVDG